MRSFTIKDTYRGDGLNLYAYVGNNPIKYVDPSGYASECGPQKTNPYNGEPEAELPGRNGALNQAKRDAGIPRSQHPSAVESVPMRTAPHEGGHVIKDANGNVINTREYHYTNNEGKKIIIQEHSAGHAKGGQGPHFNVRPAENPRTGSVSGTQDHYPFNK